MQQLSGMDAAFLHLERHNSTGHIGTVCLLDPGDGPGLDLSVLTSALEARIHLAPLLRRRLVEVPLGLDLPYWADDPFFDIEYHVREVWLPAPGSDKQLNDQVSRLHARPLDRSRPLWEIYLIGGLEDGRLALYTKVHHASVDGASGAELLTLLIDLDPAGRPLPPAEAFRPRPLPTQVGLLRAAASALVRRPAQTARLTTSLGKLAPGLRGLTSPYVGPLLRRESPDVLSSPPLLPPRTPFNDRITAQRRFAFRSIDLDEVKAIKTAHGASVNDVVMAGCAGALRRWLLRRDALPEGPLVAMMPVSVRGSDSAGAGNKISAMLAAVPTHLASGDERVAAVQESTALAKAQQAVIPPGLIDHVSDFAPPAFVARAARLAFAVGIPHRLPPFNLVISNIPGPSIRAYLAGTRLDAVYPVGLLMDGQGLNITVMSYGGRLHVGLTSCRSLVPDLEVLADDLVDEIAELHKACP